MRDRGKGGRWYTRPSARRGYAHKHASGCLTLHWHVEGGFDGSREVRAVREGKGEPGNEEGTSCC